MADNTENLKVWSAPEIYALDFNKTKGSDDIDFGEDADYLPLDPSGT